MNNIGKYAVGIVVGVILIICYIFFYHKPELKKEYDKGYKQGIMSVGITPPDTIKWIEYREVPAKPVKPKPKLDSLAQTVKLVIDTTIWYDEGNVRVYSDDIAEGLNIKPVFYEFYSIIRDTIIKMDTVYVPEKPTIDFANFSYGVAVGVIMGGAAVYLFMKD